MRSVQHQYDAIVVGLGIMGSATAATLAMRGVRVLGLDAHPLGHTRGSSHGASRIIREAIVEGAHYVPLVQRAFQLWRELEQATDRALLTIVGRLNIGSPESGCVTGALASARAYDLPHELLSPAQVATRFPGFRLTQDLVAVYEPHAGSLAADDCLAAYREVATRSGATLRYDEPIHAWTADKSGVRVQTAQGAYAAARLVLCPGPWAPVLLAELDLPLTVTRMTAAHFEPLTPERFAPACCPVYRWQVPEGDYYGFPAFAGQGVKLGRHDRGEGTTADTARRTVADADVAMLRQVLDRYMPGAAGPLLEAVPCLYTMTPDGHFLIDRHPGHDRVVYASPCSGHGFKYAPVIGEILADLATEGTTRHDITPFAASRFASSGSC